MQIFPDELIKAIESGAIVVSGSRQWNRSQRDSVRCIAGRIVDEAQQRRWKIIVGDAGGFDMMLIQAAIDDSYACQLIVMGCKTIGKFRLAVPDVALSWLSPGGDKRGSCYLIRDENMAQLASLTPNHGFLGVWNGTSTGTKKTAWECHKRGIPGLMFRPGNSSIELKDLFDARQI